MQVVIADTSPINYLVLIGHIDLLPALFDIVILPKAVQDELRYQDTPAPVRRWIDSSPAWVEVREAGSSDDKALALLDDGEKAAIALAVLLHADLLLMDERDGVSVARGMGINVTGTLGVLSLAAERGMIDLENVFERLKRTNFRYQQKLLDQLLKKHRERPSK